VDNTNQSFEQPSPAGEHNFTGHNFALHMLTIHIPKSNL